MSIFGNNSNSSGGIQFGGNTLNYGQGVDDNGYRNILGQLAKFLTESGINIASVPLQFVPQLMSAYQAALQEQTPEGQRTAFMRLAAQNMAQAQRAGQIMQRQAAMRGLGQSAQQGAYGNAIQAGARQTNDQAYNIVGPGSQTRLAQGFGNAVGGMLNNPFMQAGMNYQRQRLGLPYQSRGGMTLGSVLGGAASLAGLGGGGGFGGLGNILKFINPINGNSSGGLMSGGDQYGIGGIF